jgi:hypothetical protein
MLMSSIAINETKVLSIIGSLFVKVNHVGLVG